MTRFLWGMVARALRRFRPLASLPRRDWRGRPLAGETTDPRYATLRAPRPGQS
jgi:hypothetical protein